MWRKSNVSIVAPIVPSPAQSGYGNELTVFRKILFRNQCMDWICGVTSMQEGLRLRTVNRTLNKFERPINELKSTLAYNGKVTKVRGNLSFADWRELNTDETDALAEELGFPPGCNGQAFYKFEAGDKHYIIPAGILMCAMFRPFHGIAKYLFAPQGLDNLCMPYGNCEKPELLFFICSRRATGMQTDKAQGILNSLSWMHCFPSARQMWSSAREHAMHGQLGLKLPIGLAQYFGLAQLLPSGDFLIRDFRIRLLRTEEEPIAQFSLHTKAIEYERIIHKLDARLKQINARPKIIRKYPKDLSIPLRNGDWTLIDEEWEAIRGIVVLKNRANRLVNARSLVNLQLQKFSQGLTWTAVTSNLAEETYSRRLFSRMKSDGRWDSLITRLKELRSPN